MAQHAAPPVANHRRGHHGDESLRITEARSLPARQNWSRSMRRLHVTFHLPRAATDDDGRTLVNQSRTRRSGVSEIVSILRY